MLNFENTKHDELLEMQYSTNNSDVSIKIKYIVASFLN